MAELQEQLQAILGDPQAMGQIAAIARALTGGQSPPPPEPQAQDVEFVPVDDAAQPPPPPAREAGDAGDAIPGADAGVDLAGLMGMLSGGDVDPRVIQLGLRLFSAYSAQDDAKTALLSALKPFLRNERLGKLEKAEKVARMARVVRAAIAFWKEGEAGV